jgi:predicted SprT family Zn-dependent metalloprotease
LSNPLLPASLRIGRHRYTVEVVHRMRGRRMGSIDYQQRRITLGTVSTLTARPYRPGQVRDTFWHEVTHGILYEMGHALSRNEAFVSEFATMLTRAIETARFEQVAEAGSQKPRKGG